MIQLLTRRIEMKRAFDLCFSFVGLLVVLPLMTAIGVVVWISDRRPVLFSQERIGWHRRPFHMLKFRTMVVNAELDTGPTWSWAGDPRITSVGKILRATHLDELPQLWNVFCGSMSLVGPRPERAVFVEWLEDIVPGYSKRFDLRPGITGLSQLLSGYDESLRSVQKKIRYDVLYVRRASALLDARILVDTVLLVIGLPGGLALRKVKIPISTPRHVLDPVASRPQRIARSVTAWNSQADTASSTRHRSRAAEAGIHQ